MNLNNPVKAIRAKCLDCSCDSSEEVRNCPVIDCALYPFRFGKNPFITRTYTDEQRAKMAENARKQMEKINRRRAQEKLLK